MTSRMQCLAQCATLGSLLVVAATPASAKRLEGRVTTVKSAEVVVLDYASGDYDVRIFGIDAPEPGQPFAREAEAFLADRVLGQDVAIRFKRRNEAGEMVSMLLRGTSDIALEMVEAGLAWRNPAQRYKPQADDQPDALTAAEAAARAARRGLWSASQPTPPWVFRGETPEGKPEASPFGESVEVAGLIDLNTSQKSGADSECAIAQDPKNPLRLFVLCNTASSGLFAAKSSDGGASWNYPDPADKTIADGDAGQGPSACCDPNLAWDSYGNLFLTYIDGGVGNIVTILSTDGGATFSNVTSFAGSVDQPTVVAADTTAGVALWVVWNQSGSMVARGAPVSGLGSVGVFNALQAIPGTSNCSFGDLTVAPNGAVVQVCGSPTGGQGPSTLKVNTDLDGLGAGGFGAAVNATTTNVGGFDFIPAQNARSVDPEAGLVYDRDPASPHFGRLYLMYTEETVPENSDLEIMVRTSDDNGTTWSAAIRVNDDATTRSQFLPKIATDPATGKIGVCWHDARNSATNTAMQIFCSEGENSASPPTFSANVTLSDGSSTSNGSGVEFGDYMGLVVTREFVHPVWGDTSNSTGDNPNGTASFDAYTDTASVGGVFWDGFESNSTSRWSLTQP